VRIVAQTSFQAADGGGVQVDGHLLHSPFVIDAIGDPDSLTTALRFYGGFVDDIALDQGTVGIAKSQHITISAVRTAQKPQYSKPGA